MWQCVCQWPAHPSADELLEALRTHGEIETPFATGGATQAAALLTAWWVALALAHLARARMPAASEKVRSAASE